MDDNMWTPLHYAAHLGRTICAVILFKNGVKLDLKNKADKTPLDLAVANQQADCVTFLRLAQLTISEHMSDPSFMEALQSFSMDAQTSEKIIK